MYNIIRICSKLILQLDSEILNDAVTHGCYDTMQT